MHISKPRHPRHSFQPLLFAPPQGHDALPKTLPPHVLAPKNVKNNASLDSARPPADSYVRLRLVVTPNAPFDEHVVEEMPEAPPTLRGNIEWLEAQDLLDELSEDQLMLSMNLACLERATAHKRPRDVSTLAAFQCLDQRIADILCVRDALAVLHLSTISNSVHRAFLPDAPLADYVRGVYAWVHAVVRALDQLVTGLCIMQPDWAGYRWRVEEAKNFHFDELASTIQADLESLLTETSDHDAVMQLAAAFDGLLDEAQALEVELDERFG